MNWGWIVGISACILYIAAVIWGARADKQIAEQEALDHAEHARRHRVEQLAQELAVGRSTHKYASKYDASCVHPYWRTLNSATQRDSEVVVCQRCGERRRLGAEA